MRQTHTALAEDRSATACVPCQARLEQAGGRCISLLWEVLECRLRNAELLATTLRGRCAITWVISRVWFSEKFPSSKTRNPCPPRGPGSNAARPGDEPDVAHIEIVDDHMPVGIDDRQPCLTGRDVGPLGLFVPMQLAHDARTEAHVHDRHLLHRRHFAHCHFAGPAAVLQAVVGIRKGKCRFGSEPWSVSGAAKMSGT